MKGATEKAYRHPQIGRIFPGRAFDLNGIQYPSNWLHLAKPQEIEALGISASDEAAMTAADIAQEEDYQRSLQKREQADKNRFAALGQYVQAFESMVNTVRGGCIMLATANVKHQRLMVITFNHKGVSADTLIDIMRAMMVEIMRNEGDKTRTDDRKTILEVLSNLSSRYKAALQMRNDLLHGTWWIGFDKLDDTDYEKIVMHKMKVTRDGMQVKEPVKHIDGLRKEIETCGEIEDLTQTLWGSFLFRDRISVTKLFKNDGGRWIRSSRQK